MSETNLLRYQQRLSEIHPLDTRSLSGALIQRAANRAAALKFHYLRRYSIRRETGRHPSLGSPRALAKLGYTMDTSFYSQLLDHSPSVEFSVASARKGPYSSAALRLDDDFARDQGFVLPKFNSAREALIFFQAWQPEVVQRILDQNQLSLPRGIRAPEEFLAYLAVPGNENQIFTRNSLYARMSALRIELHKYILTENDASNFIRWAYDRYLLATAIASPEHFEELLLSTDIFSSEFLSYLGVSGFDLRIPLGAPASSYSILRADQAYSTANQESRLSTGARDTRPLDHASKP